MSKRILSLILSLTVIMSLCIMPPVAYSQEETGAYELGVMKAIGIIGSEVNAADTITRGNILDIMLRLANYNGSTDEVTQIYNDVPLTSSYASNVYAATQLGIISGSTDGNFYPDDSLSCANAVKMLVCIMGYGKKAEAMGGYTAGYYNAAKSLEMDVVGGENLTMGELSVMIYSILDASTAEINNVSADGTVSYEGGQTLLEQMDMKKYEGIYCANSAENIYGKAVAGNGKIIVGDKDILANNSYDELLGCYVEAYTRTDVYDRANLVYMEAVDTDIISVKYDEIINTTSVISDMALKAQRESDSKQKEYDFETDVCILYNGVISDVYTNSIFELSSGNVTLIDNDRNKKYDVVKIQVSDDIIAAGYSPISEVITSKYGNGINISSENQLDGFSVADTNGNAVDAASIMEWDIVSAYYNKPAGYDNRKLAKVVISQNTISGKIEYMTKDAIGIGEAEYKISPGFVSGGDLIGIENGMSATFYLNPTGEIFAAKADMLAEIGKKAGILIDAATGNGLDAAVSLKIYDHSDKMVTPELADKVQLDGEKYTKEDCYSVIAPREKVTRQLIRYTLNSDGKIDYIDTAAQGANEDDNTLELIHSMSDDSVSYFSGLGSFGGVYNIDSTTKRFSQPKDAEDDDSYMSSLRLKDDSPYGVDVYVTDNPFCAYAIVLNDAGASSMRQSEMFLVTKVSKVIDESGEEACKLSVLGQSTVTEYYMEEELQNEKNVEMGDIICFSTESETKISDLTVIYDLSEDKFFSDTNPYGAYAALQRVMMCSAYEKHGSWVSLAFDDPSEVADARALESRNVDKYRKYVWDIEEEEARAATAADIVDYISAGDACSKVFVSEASAWASMCIIYN